MSLAQAKLYDTALRLFAQKGNTQITIKELAEQTGVARGTIYNNFDSVAQIFEKIAANLTAEMTDSITNNIATIQNPAHRLSFGIRLFIQQASIQPDMGRFIIRFAATTPTLKHLFEQTPHQDVLNGIEQGVFTIPLQKIDSAMALISGGVLANIGLVLEGYKTWREAGSDLAMFLLTAFGIASEEAISIANLPLSEMDNGLASKS